VASLLEESAHRGLGSGRSGIEDLQRDDALEPSLAGSVHDAPLANLEQLEPLEPVEKAGQICALSG
jgi:hypothetical protein